MSKKKKIERRIFDMVYGKQENLSVQHKDKPDFWVKNLDGEKFGVEITEFYINESAARLKNIPLYTDELLDHKRFRHKDDIKNLNIDQIQIKNNKDKVFETTAIIQELPSIPGYLNDFNERLKEKNKSLKGYNKELLHQNLVIYDNSNLFSSIKHRQFYSYFYKPVIVKELLNSKFREIYLILNIENKDMLLPLKLILFLSRIYFFQEVLRISKNELNNEIEYYYCLVEFLTYQGFKNVEIVDNNNKPQIIYGSTGFFIDNLSTVILRDYNGYETPAGKSVLSKDFINDDIIKIIRKVENEFTFETEFGQEIRNKTTSFTPDESNESY